MCLKLNPGLNLAFVAERLAPASKTFARSELERPARRGDRELTCGFECAPRATGHKDQENKNINCQLLEGNKTTLMNLFFKFYLVYRGMI